MGSDKLGDYRPRGATPEQWEKVVPALRELLAPLDDQQVTALRYAASTYALWIAAQGYDVTLELLLNERLTAAWLATVGRSTSAATHRSRLRKAAETHRPERAARHQPITPVRTDPPFYAHEQVEQMLAHAAALRTPHRRLRAAALVLAGAGAGMDGRDHADFKPTAVQRTDSGLVVARVTGSRQPRTVAVLERYAERFFDVAQQVQRLSPDAVRMIGGSVRSVSNSATGLFDGWGGPEVSTVALRNTFLATHLAAGTPLPLLFAQAGVESMTATLNALAAKVAVQFEGDGAHLGRAATALPARPEPDAEEVSP